MAILVWNPVEHSDEENTQWCWLRAVEWINWPVFLSQSLFPVALLFYTWQQILFTLVICNWLWNFSIGRRGVIIPPLANLGVYIVASKWIISPTLAIYFYSHGQIENCWFSLLWPIFLTCGWLIPFVNLFSLLLTPPAAVRPVQDKFMMALGYVPNFASRAEALEERQRTATLENAPPVRSFWKNREGH